MDKQPIEILNFIFKQLPLAQKLECMFVCRQWAHILGTGTLFSSIHIHDQKLFQAFFDLIKQKPHLGHQVEQLKIHDFRKENLPITAFLTHLPNLKWISLIFDRPVAVLHPVLENSTDEFSDLDDGELQAVVEDESASSSSNLEEEEESQSDTEQESSSSSDSSDFEEEEDPIQETSISEEQQLQETQLVEVLKNNKIQEVKDTNKFELTRLLVKHGLCSRLVTLTLNTNANQQYSTIFLDLKDMPVLKNLGMTYANLTLDILETVHHNIPSLESFSLTSLRLLPSILPADILPATSLSRLKMQIDSMDDEEEGSLWIKYICKKYIHLTKLTCLFELQHYPTQMCEVYQVYMQDWIQRSSLTSLALEYSLDRDYTVLKSLDIYHIRELQVDLEGSREAFYRLAATEHLIHLKKLVLKNLLPTVELSAIKGMSCLEDLVLEFVEISNINVDQYEKTGEQLVEENEWDIIELFSLFPASLRSVSIESIMLTYTESTQRQFEQIKRLKLVYISVLKENLNVFLSTCLPNLTSLEMDEVYTMEDKLVMPQHRFSCLKLSPYQFDDRYDSLCLVTKECPTARYYSFYWNLEDRYSGWIEKSWPLSHEEVDLEKTMFVSCASVDKLVLFGREMFLVSHKEEFKSLKMTNR